MFDLLTIGDAILDTFFVLDKANVRYKKHRPKELCLNYGDKISIDEVHESIGGNAANVAVGARKMGLKTAILGNIGADLLGERILKELSKAKVDCSYLTIVKKKQSRQSIVLQFQSERTILSHPSEITMKINKIPKSKWIYFTSIGKGCTSVQKKLISHKKKNPEIKIALNPGTYQLTHQKEQLNTFYPHVNILFVNKEEAQKITNSKANIKTLLKKLHLKGIHLVVITDGTEGSYASDGKETLFLKPYPIKAKARTGAGDAYASGFLSSYIKKENLAEAMLSGSANASGVIQEVGAQKGLLNKSQKQKLINKYKNNKPKNY